MSQDLKEKICELDYLEIKKKKKHPALGLK